MNTPYPLGWIPPARRTRGQEKAHYAAIASIVKQPFQIKGSAPDPGPFVSFIALWRHERVLKDLGGPFTGFHQLTGSCVGAGGGNAIASAVIADILLRNDKEKAYIPWWLYPYGKSRQLIGETSEGEGSFGSAFARAAGEAFGQFASAEPGLEQFAEDQGLTLSEEIELKWSNGVAIPKAWDTVAKAHYAHVDAEIKRAEDMFLGLRNFYPMTFACNKFPNPDNCRYVGTGDSKVLLGEYDTFGPHQESVQAVWDTHPELGPIAYVCNQWQDAYRLDPKTGSKRGCWVQLASFAHMLKYEDAEVFPWTTVDGYPAQSIDIDWEELGNWPMPV